MEHSIMSDIIFGLVFVLIWGLTSICIYKDIKNKKIK